MKYIKKLSYKLNAINMSKWASRSSWGDTWTWIDLRPSLTKRDLGWGFVICNSNEKLRHPFEKKKKTKGNKYRTISNTRYSV